MSKHSLLTKVVFLADWEVKSQVSIEWKQSQVKAAIPIPCTIQSKVLFQKQYNNFISHYDATKKDTEQTFT